MSDPLSTGGSAASSHAPPSTRRPRVNPTAIRVSLVVLLLHAVVAAWALWPGREADERIARAGYTRDRTEREALLAPIGSLRDVDLDTLHRAAILLLEVDGFVGLQRLAADASVQLPREVQLPLWEAQAALALRMFTEAELALTRAQTIAPDDVRVPLLFASLHEQARRIDAALTSLAHALTLSPDAPGVALRYGRLLSAQGRLDEAAAVLASVRAPDEQSAARAELAFLHFRAGQDEVARVLLEWTLAQAPPDPQLAFAHHLLGTVRHRLEDPEGAARAWREADRLDPADPRHLAALCELTGRSPHAAREARAVANLFRRRFPTRASRIGGACFTPVFSSR